MSRQQRARVRTLAQAREVRELQQHAAALASLSAKRALAGREAAQDTMLEHAAREQAAWRGRLAGASIDLDGAVGWLGAIKAREGELAAAAASWETAQADVDQAQATLSRAIGRVDATLDLLKSASARLERGLDERRLLEADDRNAQRSGRR